MPTDQCRCTQTTIGPEACAGGSKGTVSRPTLFHARIPFGSKLEPSIFYRLTEAAKHMMARRGYESLVVFLDDLLLACETKELWSEALHMLTHLLSSLGSASVGSKWLDLLRVWYFWPYSLTLPTAPRALYAGKLQNLKGKSCYYSIQGNVLQNANYRVW